MEARPVFFRLLQVEFLALTSWKCMELFHRMV